MTLAELLELLSRWRDLTDDERTQLSDGLADMTTLDADELEQLATALEDTTDAILDAGTPDDVALDALRFIAATSEAITAETESRATDAADRDAEAQELARRIRGQADDDGGDDGDGAAGATDDGDDADDAGDDTGTGDDGEPADDAATDAEPVAAAGTPPAAPRVGRVAARRPAAARPRSNARSVAALTAAAGVPGVAMGASLDRRDRLADAFHGTLKAMGSMALRPGMRVPVATARIEYEDAAFLDGNARGNARKIEAVTAPTAVAAAGGICAVPTPRYDLPGVSTDTRPVRAGLTRFGADRGGVVIPDPMLLADFEGASQVWTVDDDVAALTHPEVRKGCLRVDCGDDETYELYAIVQCLLFGNFTARTWQERVDRAVQLANAATARKAESRLLTRMGAMSTQVSVPGHLGTARDVLTALDLATAALRNRHRMDDSVQLRWMAPTWLRSQIRADLTREMPGSADERLAAADAEIDQFFAVRRVNVSWFIDGEAGQVFGPQADGTLLGWIPNVVTYLFPEGSFLLLDGGELNLGVVRDSTLNAANDFQMFLEFFEEVAFHGVESYRLTLDLCPTGAAAGTVEPVCVDAAAS